MMNTQYPCQSTSWPANWRLAQQALLAKTLAEFLYEDIIQATRTQARWHYQTKGGVTYTFDAQPRLLNHYRVTPDTIMRTVNDHTQHAVDPIQFLIDIQKDADISPFTLAYLIQEMNNTLVADTHIRESDTLSSDELLALESHELEGWMHGHPWIVVSKGRIGFSYSDYQQFAPEMRQEQSLSWIAVSRSLSTFATTDDRNEEDFIRSELDDHWDQFKHTLRDQQLNPDDYRFMPVHDWQWNHKLVSLFANEIGTRQIVHLGPVSDRYTSMQSIRTLANCTSPHKHYVKLPMSILNTAVYRGLPGKRTLLAPALTQWAQRMAKNDAYLSEECRLILLGEVASINVDHPHCAQIEGAPYQFNELLGVIWRESIHNQLDSDERAVTMASLVHVDAKGKPFIQSLIEQSGLTTDAWIQRYLERTFPPLLHCLYQYGMVFSPHGENSILVTKNGVPERLAMKDFVDDINLSDQDLPELANMPESLKSVLLRHPGPVLTHFIYTGLYVVHFRYLSDILHTYLGYQEGRFWQHVHHTIQGYQARFPELAERFEHFPMEREAFEKVCLNRVRVLTLGYADDAERPEPDVLDVMPNPAHPSVYGPCLDQSHVA